MPTTVTKPPILDTTGQDILTQLRRIADAKEANLLGYGGAVMFADLPNPTANNLNIFYLIKDAFVTDSRFAEGAGISVPAGKYYCVINVGTDASPIYKYAEMGTLVDLSSKQDKTLSAAITVDGVTQTTVEGALGAINTEVDKTFQTSDATESAIDDADLFPFYDTSATGKKKTLWSTIKAALKTYFDTLYSSTLAGLSDTTISSPASDQVLKYNGTTWVNGTAPAGGHTMSPTPAASIPETGNNSVVSTINAQYNTPLNDEVASLYSMSRWSNEKKIRRVMDGSQSGSSIGSTGIGTWTDKDISQITTADEADWWQDNAFIIPSTDDVDVSIKFDPSGDTVALGGYILDTTTGKICIKFANSITPSTAKIAVDITYTRNEVV